MDEGKLIGVKPNKQESDKILVGVVCLLKEFDASAMDSIGALLPLCIEAAVMENIDKQSFIDNVCRYWDHCEKSRYG